MTKPYDTHIYEKEVYDLMWSVLEPEMPAPTVEKDDARPSPFWSMSPAVEPVYVPWRKGAPFHVNRSPFGILARCSIFYFDEGTPEYTYLCKVMPTMQDSKYVLKRRYWFLELAYNTIKQIAAIRVWMDDAQIEAMNDATLEATPKEKP